MPDGSGNVFVSGTSLGRFGLTLDTEYIIKLNSSGTSLLQDISYPAARGSAIALDESGRIHAIRRTNRTRDSSGWASGAFVLYGVANAAGTAVTGRIAPGELISIYGASLGNRVLFDDTEATILYASSSQSNTIVPFNRSRASASR